MCRGWLWNRGEEKRKKKKGKKETTIGAKLDML